MSAYAAVTTTGIYCRPACGASPNPSNVIRFPLAAAAEAAGYRACLRCRPYRDVPAAPKPADGVPDLVCRAVRLILDGALDGTTEDGFAETLGLSGRHLRRMFVSTVGVTPDGLARSARAHFARRLLDDTDLSITDVAFASGYGSLRQFNRACSATFRASPQALRARRRRRDRLVADGGLPVRLGAATETRWTATLRLLAARAIPGVEAIGDGTYRRTITVSDHIGVLEFSRHDQGDVVCRLHLPRWERLAHVVARARRVVGIDPELPPDAAPRVGWWDPFEAIVYVLVSDVAGGAPARLAALAAAIGPPTPGLAALGLTARFPTPAHLAAVDAIPALGEAASAVRAAARAVAELALPLDGGNAWSTLLSRLRDAGIEEGSTRRIAAAVGAETATAHVVSR